MANLPSEKYQNTRVNSSNPFNGFIEFLNRTQRALEGLKDMGRQEEYDRLQPEINALKKTNAQLKIQHNFDQNSIQQKDQQIDELQRKIDAWKKKYTSLQGWHQIARTAVKELQEQNAQLQEENDQLTSQQNLLLKQSNKQSSPLEQSNKWLNVLPKQMICIILGAPGFGKSATGHAILELFKNRLNPYIYKFPEDKIHFLPEWMGVQTDFKDIPRNSIILVDESYLFFHARQSIFDEEKRKLMEELGLARHRGHSILFVAHSTKHIDRNIVDYVNTSIFKNLGAMKVDFDRPELRDVAMRAATYFKENYASRSLCYVWASSLETTETTLELGLPTYWTDELSKAYAEGSGPAQRIPSMQTEEEKIAQARDLHAKGASYGELAKRFGVTKQTIRNWVLGKTKPKSHPGGGS